MEERSRHKKKKVVEVIFCFGENFGIFWSFKNLRRNRRYSLQWRTKMCKRKKYYFRASLNLKGNNLAFLSLKYFWWTRRYKFTDRYFHNRRDCLWYRNPYETQSFKMLISITLTRRVILSTVISKITRFWLAESSAV